MSHIRAELGSTTWLSHGGESQAGLWPWLLMKQVSVGLGARGRVFLTVLEWQHG